MVMVSKFSNFPDELSKNDELREYELSGCDRTHNLCSRHNMFQQGSRRAYGTAVRVEV